MCQEEGQGSKSKTQGPKRGRENFVSAAIGDEVLVWGGIKASQQMVDSAVWSFNVRTCKWRMLHNGKGTRPERTELAASFVIQAIEGVLKIGTKLSSGIFGFLI